MDAGSEAAEKTKNGDPLCCGILEKDDSEEEFGCVIGPVLLSFLVVVCGTCSTITMKMMYNIRSHGSDACPRHVDNDIDDATWHNCPFTKPWYQTLLMKCAMSLCLIFSSVAKWIRGVGNEQCRFLN